MIKTIETAAKNFCIHQLGIECQKEKHYTQEKKFLTYIDIANKSSNKYRVFIASSEAFIQKVATLFLEEEQSDRETLEDMALETTNLIIGSAKVISQEEGTPYDIGTPFFEGIEPFAIPYDAITILSNEKNELIIALKELDIA